MPHSIKSKLLIGAGLLVFVGFTAIIGLNSWLSLQQAENHVVQQARLQAEDEAKRLRILLERSATAAETLAIAMQSLPGSGASDLRRVASQQTRQLLAQHPDAVGIFCGNPMHWMAVTPNWPANRKTTPKAVPVCTGTARMARKTPSGAQKTWTVTPTTPTPSAAGKA